MTKLPPSNHYPMMIEWSDEDQTFVVTVPDLPGCMAHGDTPQAAAREAQAAMALWLEVAAEMGQDIPVPSRHVMQA